MRISIFEGTEDEVGEMLSNRGLAQALIVSMKNRDHEKFEAHLSEDVVLDFPGAGRIKGRRRVVLFLKALFRKYPRLDFNIEDIILEGKRACIVWINEGESNKGEPYDNRGVTFVRFSEGKIAFISDYFKDTSFTQSS